MRIFTLIPIISFLTVCGSANAQELDKSMFYAFKADSALMINDFLNAKLLYEEALSKGNLHYSHLYSLAICLDELGQEDDAYDYLKKAVSDGFENYDWLLWGGDFTNLRKQKKWEALIQQMKMEDFKRNQSKYFNTTLFDLLLEMAISDQKPRQALNKFQSDVEKTDSIEKVMHNADSINLVKMKTIIGQYGWPTSDIVEKKGEQYAWLIVQHADKDLHFQKLVLKKIKHAAKNRKTDWTYYMLLKDRIRVGSGKKQLYGTQLDNNGIPLEIKNPKKLSVRRAKYLKL